ncbi:MAG: hypothetical protein MH137_09450 [Flavobacteriales bacterium]|nr:hypothetical protein [Flavobacteriales bacterium]
MKNKIYFVLFALWAVFYGLISGNSVVVSQFTETKQHYVDSPSNESVLQAAASLSFLHIPPSGISLVQPNPIQVSPFQHAFSGFGNPNYEKGTLFTSELKRYLASVFNPFRVIKMVEWLSPFHFFP